MGHHWKLVTSRIGACCLAGSLLVPIGGCGDDDRAPACKNGTDCGIGGQTSTSGTGGGGAGGSSGDSMLSWANLYGDSAAQSATAVTTDSQGNIYFAGYYTGTMEIGDQPFPENEAHDIFIVKLNAAGEVQWIHPFGQDGASPDDQDSIALAIDPSDNVVVTSAIIGDTTIGLEMPAVLPQQGDEESLFAAKLDGDGGFVWATKIGAGGTSVTARGVACDSEGNVYLTGDVIGDGISFQGAILNLGAGGAFVVKLAEDTGMVAWARGYPHTDLNVSSRDIAVDSAGDAIVIGDFEGTLTLQDGALTSGATGPRPTDVFLIKLASADGAEIWAEQYGGSAGQQLGYAVAVDGDDNIHLAASFLEEIDFGVGPHEADGASYDPVIAKLDGDGTCLWSVAYIAAEAQQPFALDVGANGQVAFAGLFQGEMPITVPPLATLGNDDIFVAQLDSEGEVDWAHSVGGTGQQRAYGVSIDGDGNVVFVGSTDGDIDQAEEPLVHAGGGDIVIGSLQGSAPR